VGGLLARLAQEAPAEAGTRGLEAVRLAARALDVEAEENFDRLLVLDQTRGLERFPHQHETALRVLKRFRGRVMLADEVGLGKTIEAGLVLGEYLARGLVRRALVLCPPALVAQWRGELEEKFGIAARTTLDPAFRRDPAAFFAQDGVLVVSLATARSRAHRATLEAQRFDLVAVDEAHHLKNRNTRGWELVNALRARHLLLLTATPIQNSIEELSLASSGADLGWNDWEGSYRFISRGVLDFSDPRSDPDVSYPVVEYGHGDPLLTNRHAITGVVAYRHDRIPQLNALLLFADYPSGEIFYVSADDLPDGGEDAIRRILLREGDAERTFLEIIQDETVERGLDPTPRTDLRFGTGPDGRVFLLNKHDGVVREIVP